MRRFLLAVAIVAASVTVLNLWFVNDGIRALPDYTASATDDVRNAAALDRAMIAADAVNTPSPQFKAYCRQSGSARNDPACAPQTVDTPNPDYSSESAIQKVILREAAQDDATYNAPLRRAIWNRAAKVEFVTLVVGGVLWLLLLRLPTPKR